MLKIFVLSHGVAEARITRILQTRRPYSTGSSSSYVTRGTIVRSRALTHNNIPGTSWRSVKEIGGCDAAVWPETGKCRTDLPLRRTETRDVRARSASKTTLTKQFPC